MKSKKTAVFGIYKSRSHAENAVNRILEGGFTNNDISVLLGDAQSSKDFANEKDTKAPEGATVGVSA